MANYYLFPCACSTRPFLLDEVIAAVADARQGGPSLETYSRPNGEKVSELFGPHGRRMAAVATEPDVALMVVETLVNDVLHIGARFADAVRTEDVTPYIGCAEEIESLVLQRSGRRDAFLAALALLIGQILNAYDAGESGTENAPIYELVWMNTSFRIGYCGAAPMLEIKLPRPQIDDYAWAYPLVHIDLSKVDGASNAVAAAVCAIRRDAETPDAQARLARKQAFHRRQKG